MPPKVVLVRHGESQYNLAMEVTGQDPFIWDAPLSPRGEWQAQFVSEFLSEHFSSPDVILVSPHTRAIQTMCLSSFHPENKTNSNFEVTPEIRETVTASDDIGSTPEMLEEKFPFLTFDHLEHIWWSCKERDLLSSQKKYKELEWEESEESIIERVHAFEKKLSQRSEDLIICFGHCNIFHELMNIWGGDYYQGNCEVVSFDYNNRELIFEWDPDDPKRGRVKGN